MKGEINSKQRYLTQNFMKSVCSKTETVNTNLYEITSLKNKNQDMKVIGKNGVLMFRWMTNFVEDTLFFSQNKKASPAEGKILFWYVLFSRFLLLIPAWQQISFQFHAWCTRTRQVVTKQQIFVMTQILGGNFLCGPEKKFLHVIGGFVSI